MHSCPAVTVPILLSLGIGVMKSLKQKKLAKAVLEKATATNTGKCLGRTGCQQSMHGHKRNRKGM